MIKVILRDGTSVKGDWNIATVQPRIGSGSVVAVTLDLKGKDGDASFVLSEVIGWMVVPEGTADTQSEAKPRKATL